MMFVVIASLLAAPGSGRIWAHAERCPPGLEPELRRLLAIELKAPVAIAPGDGDSQVAIRCEGDHYFITLTAPLRPASALEIDVVELAPLAIPRAVTLVVAEALTRLWAAPPVEPPMVVEAPPPQAPVPVVERRHFELSVLAVGRVATVPLFGGGLVVDLPLLRWLGLRVDVNLTRGQALRTAGTVTATLVDAAATFDVRHDTGRWLVRAGLGLRAGLAVLDGHPLTPDVVGGTSLGALWGPQVAVSAAWRPASFLTLGLGVDGGLWAPRLEGTVLAEAPVRLEGPFASVWASAGVRW